MKWACLLLVSCATEPTPLQGIQRDVGVEAEVDATVAGPSPGAIRVAAFNVRRLFDSTCDSGACTRTDFEAVLTSGEIETRTTTIAERLLSLRADAMCLEEVETQQLLDKVASKMPSHVTHVLGETGFTASVDVGLISTFPLITTKRHRNKVLTRPDGSITEFAREFLEVHLDVRGKRAIVFCAHFRSKSSDDPGRRWAEARAAREILTAAAEANPGALVVLGGDLNDVPGSDPINELELGGVVSRTSAGLPTEQIATYYFESRGSAIDHLYVVGLARYQPATFRVARDNGSLTFAGSDHAAVVADFTGF